MNRYTVFLLLAAWWPWASQGQLNNTGAQLIVSGGYLVMDDLGLVNNGVFTHTAGTVKFTGTGNSSIAGTTTPQFNAIELNKSGASVLLQTGITVNDQILFTNGLLNLNNNNITLGSAAYLNGENENSRITGITGGYVQITSLLNAPAAANPGNLGIIITAAANLGSTVIRRGHVSQTNGSNMGNSIFRYYDVQPANNSALQASVGINYFDAELNGLGESLLTVWKSSSTSSWSSLGYNSRNVVTNFVDQTNIPDMARFTLSSELYVLPLTISELHTTCLNNQVVITWKTSGEFVNGKFIVGRSSDGTSWQPIAVIAAAGKGNQPHTYAYTDAQSFNGAYYRIEQQDVNGKATVYPMVKSSCTVSDLVSVYPNPAYGNCWLQLQSVNKTKVDMRLYDHKGALVKQLLGNAEAGLTQFDLQVGSLAQGIYSLFVYWGNGNVKTIRIVKL